MEEGDAEKTAWHRRLRQRDGQPSRALALAHTHAHSHTRSHPRHSATVGPRHPSPHTRLPPRPVLTVAICIGGNFLQASSSSRPLQPPRVPLTLGPGFAPAGPPLPSPLGSPPCGLHHIPPWSVAHARGPARGSGARGCACIARLLLAAHTVHGSEGASEGGTGSSAATAAAADPAPSSAPCAAATQRWDPTAAVPSQNPLLRPRPRRPLISICTAPASSRRFHRSRCLQGFFFFFSFLSFP